MVWHVLRNGTLISLPHKRKTHQRCMRWARNASGPCWRGLTRGTASWLAVVSAVTPPHHNFGQSRARGRLRRRPLAIGGFRFLASRERWAVGRWDEWALFSCAVRNQQSREVTEALTLEPAQTSSFYPLDLAAAHQEPKPSTVEGRRRSHGTSHALPCQLPLLNW
jgi:hypothetical protein